VAVVSRRASRRRFTLALLILTSITLITLDFRGFEPLERVRSAVLSAFAPVGDATAGIFRPLGDAWDGAFQQGSLADENERLRQELDDARGQLRSNEIAGQSLEQLLELADLPFVGDLARVQADVVSGAVSNFDPTVEIDKGSDDGITPGMAVVTGQGLVGKVAGVSADRSVVQLLSGGKFRVGFSVVGTSVIGTAQGSGDSTDLGGTVDRNGAVATGQVVVTDGIGDRSTFPRGLPVGTITAVEHDPGALHQDLVIQMLADLSDLTYVSVVLWEPAGP
jgi:rod shape-determining protein MreC